MQTVYLRIKGNSHFCRIHRPYLYLIASAALVGYITAAFHNIIIPERIPDTRFRCYAAFKIKGPRAVLYRLPDAIKAYDYMLRFDADFKNIVSSGTAYELLVLACEKCKVELAHTEEEIKKWGNGSIMLGIYTENDIETWRDVIFYVAQVLGRFATINRAGQLELRKYGNEPVADIPSRQRFSSSFSDFVTRYTAISSTNVRTQTAVPTVYGDAFMNVCTAILPASTELRSPVIFLSFLDFAPASRGFLPTHFNVCFPLTLNSYFVMRNGGRRGV